MTPHPSIESRLLPLARIFRPELEELAGDELINRVADVISLVYSAPISLAGLIWLVIATDLAVIAAHWPLLLVSLALVVLLRRLNFTLLFEFHPGHYADWRESLERVVSWSAALLFGPTALWLTVLGVLTQDMGRRSPPTSSTLRWNRARNVVLNLTQVTAGLVALTLYRRWGGTFPPLGTGASYLVPAFLATLVGLLLFRLFWMPIFAYWYGVVNQRFEDHQLEAYIGIVTALPGLIDPFAILAALFYVQIGPGGYFFLIAGVVLASLLSNRLSKSVIRSRQRSRELAKLEQLGRALIESPVDAASLPGVLAEHVPAMFPGLQVDIALFQNDLIYRPSDDLPPVPPLAWDWIRETATTRIFLPGDPLPWGGRLVKDALVLAPILEPEGEEPIGGIALQRRMQINWDVEALTSLLPAVQSLAAQIGSALHGAEVYRVEQELALAGQIQASFLPSELPEIAGWQLSATLEPARETAGDFYDVVPLPNGRFGIVVADVADKGMGAALYMALSRTLLRTYAITYHTRPDFAMKVTNRRILMDTDVTMFVTTFYGVLDPAHGTLTYSNAGHNPPYLVRGPGSRPPQPLTKTGMALGAMPGMNWEQRTVEFAPGDALIVYTDGVTEAQNPKGDFFGQERLLELIRQVADRPAWEIKETILEAVHTFTAGAPRSDDITLLILVRDNGP
jgi:hypothetical protein